MSVKKENAYSVFAGAFAGGCSTLATNPLDVIRTRLQASRGATGKNHKSLVCHLKDLFGEGVMKGMTTGLMANVLASMPSNAIYLPTYRAVNSYCQSKHMDVKIVPIISAFSAVALTNITLSPVFVIRSQVQTDAQPIRDVALKIFQQQGMKGFYRGLLTNVGGRFVEEGLFWSSYEFLKRSTNEGSIKTSNHFLWNAVTVMSLTSASKMFGTIVAYPYNVVMTHIRTPNKLTGNYEHSNVLPTVRYIYRNDGVLGFYKGLLPQLLRSVVSKATQIYAFELAMAAYLTAQRPSPQLAAH